MHELIALPYSPWSEKARWALDVRGVPYRYRTFQPLLGEPELRWRTGRWTGNVTVPVLLADDGTVLTDSAHIARFADDRGTGPTLFPAGEEATVQRWIDASETGLAAARALALHRQLRDDEALAELVPRGLRRALGPLAPRVGGIGVRRTLRKYGAGRAPLDQHVAVLRGVLDALRAAVGATPGRTILPALSFADIAAAQVLGFVQPPSFGLRMGRASRRGFIDPELSVAYADLVAWRDTLYEAHRPRT